MKNKQLVQPYERKVIYFDEITEKDVFSKLINLEQLTFELTDACNLKCKYCGYGEFYTTHDKRENRFMDFNIAKRIIDYLFEIWRKHPGKASIRKIIIGFYGGEPLLNMNLIFQIIGYIETLPPVPHTIFEYNMTTNAILLDKYMEYLYQKKITLLLSLDGDKYAHSYRIDHSNHNSFDKAFKNIKLLMTTCPDYFNKYVNFNSVLHDRNNVKAIREFIKKEFNKIAQISELNQFGVYPNRENEFKTMFHSIKSDINTSDPDFENMFPDKMGLFRFVSEMAGNYFYLHNFLIKKKINKIPPTGTCLPFEKKIFITVNGKILPCEKIDQKYTLGYVKDNGVELDLRKVAQIYSAYYKKIMKLCVNCYMKPFCSQCMFYMYDLDGCTKCPSFANKQDIINYINYYSKILHEHPDLYKKVSNEMLFKL